jgi:hypothetical protein
MQAVTTTDEHQDRVGLRQHGTAWLFVRRQRTKRRQRLELGPVAKRHANVFEVHARNVQRETTLFTATYRCIEIGQLGFVHRSVVRAKPPR